jgi:hypothetical protein
MNSDHVEFLREWPTRRKESNQSCRVAELHDAVYRCVDLRSIFTVK